MLTVDDQFNAMLYGVPDQESIRQFKESANRVARYIPEHFKHVHQRTLDTVKRWSNFDYQQAMRVAAAHATSAWHGDHISQLDTVEALQAAAPKNIRWNMAEPTYRELYHQGQANGYGKDYVDMEPEFVGTMHTDYRRVTHGQWIEDEEDDMAHMVMYDTDVSNDENEEDILVLSQQLAIQQNWLKIREETERKRRDIGCPLGGNL